MSCGITKSYIPVERGIELGRPTLHEILAIEDEAREQGRSAATPWTWTLDSDPAEDRA